jgi:hypothetical protein
MRMIFSRGRLDNSPETGKKPVFWGILLFAVLLKYGYYGLTYFPTIDDHNMYGVFSMMSPVDALLKYKMYTTRPLAVLLDTFVISRLWGYLWIILLLFTLMHFASSYLVYKVFEKNSIRTGAVLAIVFSMMPLSNDATYWIAASSRLIPGLFFSVLSFYLYMQYLERSTERKPRTALYAAGFALSNLVSLGFYEQIIAFSFIGILLLMAVNFKRQGNKWVDIIPFANIAITGAFYAAFSSSGNMASRGQLLQGDYIQHTINVYKRIKELLTTVPASLIKHGTINGIQMLLADGAIIFVLLAAAVSAGLGILYAREKVSDTWKGSAIKFFVGLFLVFLPFAPFFVLQVIWIVYRNAFISLIGVGLIIESLAGVFFMRRDLKIPRGIIAGAVVFLFLLGNVAEMKDYRSIAQIDREIVTNTAEAMKQEKGQDWSNYEAVVFNTKPVYITPTSKHFSNCTGAGWAYTGAMSSILRQRSLKAFNPVADGQPVPVDAEKLKQCVLLGLDAERKVLPLTGEWKSDSELELRLESGEVFGKVSLEEDGPGIFELQK